MTLSPLAEIRPGMINAADVKDRSGRLLLAKGAEINDRHLRLFRMWGVTGVEIVEASEESTDAGSNASAVVVKGLSDLSPEDQAEIELLYKGADRSHPFIKQMISITVDRMAQRAEARGKHSADKQSPAEGAR